MDEIKITARMLRGNRNSIIGRRNILEFNESVRTFNKMQQAKERNFESSKSTDSKVSSVLKEPRLKTCLRGFY